MADDPGATKRHRTPTAGRGRARSQRSLSVVLPAYNEEENIESAIDEARQAVQRLTSNWEIVVVDDGSRDATAALVEAMHERDSRVRLVRFPRNRGYGAAIRAGFSASRGDLIFYTDSDRQFDISELRFFLPLMDETDVAIGFRVYRYDTVVRCMTSWLYNRLVSLMFRVRVRDVDCSFKLFRREVLESMDLESTDFFIDTELVAKARKWNFRLLEKGVRHYPRKAGESTVHVSHIPRTLRTVFRMWVGIYLPVLVGSRKPRTPVCAADRETTPFGLDASAAVETSRLTAG